MIRTCKSKDCNHEAQDRMYGKNNRVMNPTKDGFKCTVCGNVVRLSGSKVI
jgi:hypothetical protein